MIRVGIDVGGTNTDAVAMDGKTVRAGVKAATTTDVTSGVVAALKSVLAASGLEPQAIDVVMIGTTHFTNAVVQRRDLAPTAAVRLGLPATASLPPMVDWPDDLRAAIGGHAYLAHGGHEFDGREISPLDEAELLGIAADIRAKGVRSVAIASVFSPVNTDCEAARRQDSGRSAARRAFHAVERHRPHRPARARERGDHERVPARSCEAGRRRFPRGARRLRRQSALLSDARTTAR